MKKKWMVVFGVVGMFAVVLGAVVFEARKDTVSTWGDCISAYLEARENLPPVPLPASAEELLEKAEREDWAFMTDKTWYLHQPMTLYVAADSKLAKEMDGQLPAKLVIMEDIRLGQILLFGVDGKGAWNPVASYTAPVIMDETDEEFIKLSAEEKSRDLFFELSYRRVIGEITFETGQRVDRTSGTVSGRVYRTYCRGR